MIRAEIDLDGRDSLQSQPVGGEDGCSANCKRLWQRRASSTLKQALPIQSYHFETNVAFQPEQVYLSLMQDILRRTANHAGAT